MLAASLCPHAPHLAANCEMISYHTVIVQYYHGIMITTPEPQALQCTASNAVEWAALTANKEASPQWQQ